MTGNNPMRFFSDNVDAWGPLEWFDRLAKAVHARSRSVSEKDDLSFELYQNIASSSATRLVSDFEDKVRMALTTLRELEKANVAYVDANTALISENKRLQAEIDRKSSMPGDHRYWEGRYRDEAAENEKLKAGIKRLSDEEELLAETTDGDLMSLVSLAAKLAEAEQLARTYEGEANQLRDVSISNRIRAEEAEAGENKLREALRPFVTVSENWVDNSGWTKLSCKNDRIVDWFGASDFLRARTALASTGGKP